MEDSFEMEKKRLSQLLRDERRKCVEEFGETISVEKQDKSA